MGKKLCKLLLLVLVTFALGLMNEKSVSAETIDVKIVDDIDNFVNPETMTVPISGANVVTAVEFRVPKTGTVKSYIMIGRDARGSGSAWISRDYKGNDVIGQVKSISKNDYLTEYLDAGTYYLQLRWSELVYSSGVAIGFEETDSGEEYTVSNIDLANPLKLEEYQKGFLTATTPKDYYEFTLDELTYLDIQYSFDPTSGDAQDVAEMTLYNKNHIVIGSGKYDSISRGLVSAKYKLEAGTYYISMYGFKGDTALYLKPMYYRTKLLPSITEWTDEDVTVKIDTTIDFQSIDVIKYDVTKTDLNSNNLWNVDATNKKYVETNGTSFIAKSNGVYSIRIKDQVGEYQLVQIEITNIDKTAPTVTGVTNNKIYKTAKTITWKDKDGSGVKKVTLNGKTVKSGIQVTKQGEYTLKLYDVIGNKRTVTFIIDKTNPVINGITNGKTYTDYVIATVSDDLTGIKEFTVNGEVVDSNTYYFINAGTYVIKVSDKAGNTVQKVIKIK